MEPNKFARTSSSPAAYLSELLRKQTFSMFIILLLIWVILSFLSPYFFTVNNLFEITLQSAVFAIIAAGETFVIFSGGIDLSVGSVFAFSSIVGGLAFQFSAHCLPLSCPFLRGIFAGLVNGACITKLKVPPLWQRWA